MSEKHKTTKNEMPYFSHFSRQKKLKLFILFSSFRMREPNYGEQNRFVFAWAKSTFLYHINMRYMS